MKCLRCAEFKTRYECSLKHAFMQISMKHFVAKIAFNKNPVENTGLMFAGVLPSTSVYWVLEWFVCTVRCWIGAYFT